MMEAVIRNQYRNKPTISTTTVIRPKSDEVFAAQKVVELRLEGFSTLEPPYQLYIYSNNEFEIENNYTKLSAALKTKREGNQYTFIYYADVPFDFGLYYLVIRRINSQELMYISRFSVE